MKVNKDTTITLARATFTGIIDTINLKKGQFYDARICNDTLEIHLPYPSARGVICLPRKQFKTHFSEISNGAFSVVICGFKQRSDACPCTEHKFKKGHFYEKIAGKFRINGHTYSISKHDERRIKPYARQYHGNAYQRLPELSKNKTNRIMTAPFI